MKRHLLLALTLFLFGAVARAQEPASPVSPAGDWQGVLVTPGGSLNILFHIKEKPGGGFSATMDSPDQHATGLAMDEVTFKDGRLHMVMKIAGGGYDGTLSPDGKQITGKWTQSGMSLDLNLTPGSAVTPIARPKRPQEPVKPYPYRSLEVFYPNRKAHIRLAGTLTLPKGKGPFPAAILITGSGRQDRDETVADHKPFLILSDYLTRRGIAVLRSDDRGAGKSGGPMVSATTADFAADVESALDYLKSRPEIDRKKIGLIGHSEGGTIAPMVAARRPDVAFIVLMAGPGVNGEQVLYAQEEATARAMGMSEKENRENVALNRKAFAVLKRVKDPVKARERLLAVMAPAGAPAEQRTAAQAQIPQLMSPWFRYFLTYDPAPALRRVRCPVLAVNGSKDVQVIPSQNLPAIWKALSAGRNRDVTLKELPGLNHLFQTAKTGAPSEYRQIEETMSPTALKAIGDWVVKRTSRG